MSVLFRSAWFALFMIQIFPLRNIKIPCKIDILIWQVMISPMYLSQIRHKDKLLYKNDDLNYVY